MSFEKLKINNFYNLTLYPDFINYIIKDVDNLSNFKKTCSENLFNCIKNNYNDLIVKIIENNLFDFNYCDISGNNVYHFLFDNIKFNPNPVYYYRIHQQNDHFVDPQLQKNVADEIFSKKRFMEMNKIKNRK